MIWPIDGGKTVDNKTVLKGKSSSAPPALVSPEYMAILLKLTSYALRAEGDLIEVGVYRGGSLHHMADHIR
jgi:hypothetical protein